MRDHLYLTDHKFVADAPAFQYNWTCHQRQGRLSWQSKFFWPMGWSFKRGSTVLQWVGYDTSGGIQYCCEFLNTHAFSFQCLSLKTCCYNTVNPSTWILKHFFGNETPKLSVCTNFQTYMQISNNCKLSEITLLLKYWYQLLSSEL